MLFQGRFPFLRLRFLQFINGRAAKAGPEVAKAMAGDLNPGL